MKTISIIIPTFNEEETIKEILLAINNNKHDSYNFEVIVVDDGSSDKTQNILSSVPHLYSKKVC